MKKSTGVRGFLTNLPILFVALFMALAVFACKSTPAGSETELDSTEALETDSGDELLQADGEGELSEAGLPDPESAESKLTGEEGADSKDKTERTESFFDYGGKDPLEAVLDLFQEPSSVPPPVPYQPPVQKTPEPRAQAPRQPERPQVQRPQQRQPQSSSWETPSSPPVTQPVPEPSKPEDDQITPLLKAEHPEIDRIVLPSRPESYESEIVFSRVVRASAGQLVEIPYRGTGWVYLGELGNRRGITYDSRRLDVIAGVVEGQSFIFRTEAAGTYILKFYKHDFIKDYIINDHVQVIVGEAENSRPGRYVDRGRVIAEPRWPSPDYLPESAQGSSEAKQESSAAASGRAPQQPAPSSAQPQTSQPQVAAPQAAQPSVAPPQSAAVSAQPASESSSKDLSALGESPVQEPLALNDPAEFVRRAKLEFDAGKVDIALGIMDSMLKRYPSGTDEAYWLLGQLYEANSPLRDIRLSLEYYRRLVKEYPQSHRVPDAQRRIAYLERYYFNIR